MFSDARARMARTAGARLALELIEAKRGGFPIWDGIEDRSVEERSCTLAVVEARILAAAQKQGAPEVIAGFETYAVIGFEAEMKYFARSMAIWPHLSLWARYSSSMKISAGGKC